MGDPINRESVCVYVKTVKATFCCISASHQAIPLNASFFIYLSLEKAISTVPPDSCVIADSELKQTEGFLLVVLEHSGVACFVQHGEPGACHGSCRTTVSHPAFAIH